MQAFFQAHLSGAPEEPDEEPAVRRDEKGSKARAGESVSTPSDAGPKDATLPATVDGPTGTPRGSASTIVGVWTSPDNGLELALGEDGTFALLFPRRELLLRGHYKLSSETVSLHHNVTVILAGSLRWVDRNTLIIQQEAGDLTLTRKLPIHTHFAPVVRVRFAPPRRCQKGGHRH